MSPTSTPSEDTATATPAPPAQSGGGGNSNSNSNSNSRRNRNGNSRNNNRSNNNSATTVQSTEGSSFEGGCPDVNAVVGLRTEKINKKVPFSVFTERLADYVITELKHASDIELSIRVLADPYQGFVERHKPQPLMFENPSFDEKYMQQERIKSYIVRENTLKDNVIKVYGLIWRQCTSALQAVIKGTNGYTIRSRGHDMIWLLEQIQSVTSGVDVKANAHVVLYDAMSALFNMRQQANESNDRYTERFKANVQTVDLAKGGHICSYHTSYWNAKTTMTPQQKK